MQVSERIELIENNNAIGFIDFQIVADFADIHDVVIIPTFRGKGYGSKLMHLFLTETIKRGVAVVTLEVRTDNVNAIALYEKFGFEYVAVRKAYYNDGCDGLLMKLDN